VTGFDFDPEAVRVARTNARANRVSPTLRRQDLTRLPRRSRSRHEVICANLIFDLLIQERDRILHRLAPGGRLLLAGILTTQFDRVTAAYAEAGMRLVARRVEKEWCSGAFRHR
jgi:ribosomal protein L11 methyltransferase